METSVPELLRKIKKLNRYTWAHMAAELKISRQTLDQWKNGKVIPRHEYEHVIRRMAGDREKDTVFQSFTFAKRDEEHLEFLNAIDDLTIGLYKETKKEIIKSILALNSKKLSSYQKKYN